MYTFHFDTPTAPTAPRPPPTVPCATCGAAVDVSPCLACRLRAPTASPAPAHVVIQAYGLAHDERRAFGGPPTTVIDTVELFETWADANKAAVDATTTTDRRHRLAATYGRDAHVWRPVAVTALVVADQVIPLVVDKPATFVPRSLPAE